MDFWGENRIMKILAIDDNQDNLTSLRAVVMDQLPGVIILTAITGAQGIAMARSEDPDVILLDIVMPDMDGYAVCQKLKEDNNLHMIPVLFLTALRTDRDSRVKALEVGADGFLSKPFDEIELTAQILAMVKIKAAALAQRHAKDRLADLVNERTMALQQSHHSMLNLLEDLQTENKARELVVQALRASEARLRHAQLLARMGTYEIDVVAALWVSSPMLDEIFGIDSSDAHTMDAWTALIHPAWREKITMDYANHVRTKNNHFDQEYQIVRRNDGAECWVHSIAELEFNAQNQPVRIIGTIQDVTARKQAEDAIGRQMDELRRWQTATLGREGRIGELKREVNALAGRFGQPLPYATPEELERHAIR